MKCYTKYKVNATNFFVAIAQNRVNSEFLVLKIHLSNTVEIYRKVNGHESLYRTKFQDNAANT